LPEACGRILEFDFWGSEIKDFNFIINYYITNLYFSDEASMEIFLDVVTGLTSI